MACWWLMRGACTDYRIPFPKRYKKPLRSSHREEPTSYRVPLPPLQGQIRPQISLQALLPKSPFIDYLPGCPTGLNEYEGGGYYWGTFYRVCSRPIVGSGFTICCRPFVFGTPHQSIEKSLSLVFFFFGCKVVVRPITAKTTNPPSSPC